MLLAGIRFLLGMSAVPFARAMSLDEINRELARASRRELQMASSAALLNMEMGRELYSARPYGRSGRERV